MERSYLRLFPKVIPTTMLHLIINSITIPHVPRRRLASTVNPLARAAASAKNDRFELLASRARLSRTNSRRGAGVASTPPRLPFIYRKNEFAG